MADVLTGMIAQLKTRPAITGRVGVGDAARIYPDDLKQGATMPAIVVAELDGDSEQSLSGFMGVVHSVVEVMAYGSTREQSSELCDAVRLTSKTSARQYWGQVYVGEVNVSSHRTTGVDEPQDASDSKRYWARLVLDIWHHEQKA